jgi:hypothetical protein
VTLNVSKGFATMENETFTKKTQIKPLITPSFIVALSRACNTQMGVINMATPTATMRIEIKRSMRLSE